jgi:hypothetical protein
MYAALRSTEFSKVMSRDRWHEIKWSLSCTSEELDRPVVPEADPSYDRCWKIRHALAALVAACRRLVKQGRNVSLDEAMVKCTGMVGHQNLVHDGVILRCRCVGRVLFRIRIPTKPIRDGIKIYVLCDADTG